jgi:two-component system sensor histidine kinase KdpD
MACVLSSTTVAYALQRYAQSADLAMIQLLGIVFVALRFNVKVSLIASLISVALFDFLFVPPRLAFAWSDVKSIITFTGMIVVAAVISVLNERLREQERIARETANRTKALYELHVELSSATQLQQLIAITSRHLERSLSSSAVVLVSDAAGALEQGARGLSAAELELAELASQRREFTANASFPGYNSWVPLVGIREPLGTIGIAAQTPFRETSDSGLLLSACANQLATAIERSQLANVVHRAQVEAETERMRSSLLSAVSHDLKTPLATIVAAGTTLLDRGKALEANDARDLLGAMVSEAERLGRLIQNLLSVTRLESPTVELRRSPEAVEEIVSAAVERINAGPGPKRIQVAISQELPWVLAEPALIEQVLVNLLENAMRYAGTALPIDVSANLEDNWVTVQVADRGSGISEGDIDKVFEKFYRGQQSNRRDGGVGLGLTICRAIVRAHGGKIGIRNRQGGGTIVEFTLPVAGKLEARPSDAEVRA